MNFTAFNTHSNFLTTNYKFFIYIAAEMDGKPIGDKVSLDLHLFVFPF
jgi:hypothetical protein